jgi:tellurite methyltransferase
MTDEAACPYDARYADDACYWGRLPSALCDRVIGILDVRPDQHPTLIDLGCGEGRNALYFARQGFTVTGVDLSQVGLAKLTRNCRDTGVNVATVCADIAAFDLGGTYDVVFSTGAVHYIPPEMRRDRFDHFKAHTAPHGIHAHSALVGKPFLPPAPDADPGSVLFVSGELLGYYWDWEILYSVEEIFDCLSGGIPHKHAVDRVIARRYAGNGPG